MATKAKFQAIKGTRDLLPPETELWNRVEGRAGEVFGTFGFGEIRPPILEPSELFARSIGIETDVVAKEMYSFPKKLEILRRATTDQVGQVDSESSILKFGQSLAVLVFNLEQALKSKDIPDTEHNQEAIKRLRAISDDTVIMWNSGHRIASEEWTGYFKVAREIIEGLDIERI